MWKAGNVAQIDPPTDAIVGDWLTVPEVADRLGLPVSRVKQLLRERKLLGVQRPSGAFCAFRPRSSTATRSSAASAAR